MSLGNQNGAHPNEMGRSCQQSWAAPKCNGLRILKNPAALQTANLVMFSGATQSGCGFAQSAMGPFYCPLDQKVYLDTSFFQT
jgi:predicted metalloprotease